MAKCNFFMVRFSKTNFLEKVNGESGMLLILPAKISFVQQRISIINDKFADII